MESGRLVLMLSKKFSWLRGWPGEIQEAGGWLALLYPRPPLNIPSTTPYRPPCHIAASQTLLLGFKVIVFRRRLTLSTQDLLYVSRQPRHIVLKGSPHNIELHRRIPVN